MITLLDPPDAPPTEAPPRRLRVRKSRVVAVAIIAGVVLVATAWLLSWWSPVPVREVVVAGASPDTAQQIESVARIETGTALRDIDASGIEQRVGQLQGIDEVALVLQRPWTVVIEVAERFPFAVVLVEDRWTVLDRDGQPVRDVAQRPPRLPEVLAPVEQRAAALTALAALDEQLRTRLTSVALDEQGSVRLTFKGGSEVEWGLPELNEQKARVLRALLPLRASRYSVAVPERPALSPDARLPKETRRLYGAPVPQPAAPTGPGADTASDQTPAATIPAPQAPDTAATPDLE